MELKEKLRQGLKSILTSLGEELPPVEVKLVSAKLDDGTEINMNADVLAAGVAVTVVTAEGETAIPDGTYKLEDGTEFSTVEGVVTEVSAPAPADAAPQPAEMSEEIKAQFSKQEKEINSLKLELSKVSEGNKTALSVNEKILTLIESLSDTPIQTATETKLSANAEKLDAMSAFAKNLQGLKKQ